MLRREFIRLLTRITGGTAAATLVPPLLRINTAFLSEARGECVNLPDPECQQDCCTVRDNCGQGDADGHNCTNKDICDTDASGNCNTDECLEDTSSHCETDRCETDTSESCGNDICTTDNSGACSGDQCLTDASGACIGDSCDSDSLGVCTTDQCREDQSGSCKSDNCSTDTSGTCKGDNCRIDSSQACSGDQCQTDSSEGCVTDHCLADTSGACGNDTCVLDRSSSCENDLCREDRTPVLCEADVNCTNDNCSLDLAMNLDRNRRHFTRAGLNQTLRWLYKLAVLLLVLCRTPGALNAAPVIDARNAVFSPAPVYTTGQAVAVPNPVGPFLRDCDGDGILEADTNGDGQCTGDPKLTVMENTGDATKGLPAGTAFTGTFEFTCFYIPSEVALVATGPLAVKASREVAVFGAVRLPHGAEFSTSAKIDLRTSAWLSDSDLTFTTALAGEVDETSTPFSPEESLAPIFYQTLCGPQKIWLPLMIR